MPRGYRSAFVATGLIALASWGLSQSPENLRSDQPVEQQPAEAESTEQSTVEPDSVVEPPAAPTEPAAEAHDKDAGNQEDGEAQRDAFKFWGDSWAQWAMAVTGCLALIISAWAVWLVSRTLIEARKGTKAAVRAAIAAEATVGVTQDIGKKQVRAYLSVADAFVSAERDGDTVRFRTNIRIKNSGQSPAKGMSFKPVYFRPTIRDNDEIFVGDFGAGEERCEGHTAAFEISDLKYPPDEKGTVNFEVEITLVYRDVFNDPHDDFKHWFNGRPALTNAPHPLNRVRTQVVAIGTATERDTAGSIDVNPSTGNEAD